MLNNSVPLGSTGANVSFHQGVSSGSPPGSPNAGKIGEVKDSTPQIPKMHLPKVDAQQLEDTFISAAQIWAPSGQEKEMADKMKADYEALRIPGLKIEVDDSAPKTGCDTGNVIVDIPATDNAPPDAKSILLSFHLDRVPVHAPGVPEDEPVVIERQKDGTIHSKDFRTNIAADDRTGYTAVTEAIRNIALSGYPHGKIRVIGFVGEEPGLLGAQHLDPKYLQGLDYGFEMDGGKVGNIIAGGAGIHRFTAVVTGESAPSIHARGGKNALVAGMDAVQKLTAEETKSGQVLNISNFYAGKHYYNKMPVTNAVPDTAELSGEVRGRTPEDEMYLKNKVDTILQDTAKTHGVDVDVNYVTLNGFQLADNSPVVKFAQIATENAGIKPKNIPTTMGGSDANFINAKGLPTVVLGSGAFKQHSEQESTSVNAMVSATRVVMSLIASAANPAVAAALASCS